MTNLSAMIDKSPLLSNVDSLQIVQPLHSMYTVYVFETNSHLVP